MRDLFTSFKDNCGFGLLCSIDNTPTHQNLEDAITSLSRMMHRGAIAADGKTGDGSGLLLSFPKTFFEYVATKDGVSLPEQYAVAMVFSRNEDDFDIMDKVCGSNDLEIIYTRTVPVDTNALGKQALETLPTIKQVFVAPKGVVALERFDALVYLSRKEIEYELKHDKDFYISSFSTKVISYKGLVMPTHIKEFYQDLADKNFKISFCLFHQRFSTNTLPEWRLAQPFRMIAHNGEINSVTANRFNVKAKMAAIKSEIFTDKEIKRLTNVIQDGMSDSASLDNFMEFLRVNGVDFFKAARSLIPAPWHNAPQMDSDLKAFYEYTSTCFEPWDGPAAVSMTDGRYIGCVLDRNGLRPSKYIITTDNRLLISSEYGVLQVPEEQIAERGRLQSGEMMGVDLKFGKILKSKDIDDYLKSMHPYNQWISKNMSYLQEHVPSIKAESSPVDHKEMEAKQRYFNFTLEVMREVIKPMISEGKETTGAMGDDTPIAAFSTEQRNFTDFFKQKFAQVTNPPIDPIREKIVTSLNTGFGEVRNILSDDAEYAKRLKTVLPIMSTEKFTILKEFGDEGNEKYDPAYKFASYNTAYTHNLRESLNKLVEHIISDVRDNGIRTIILDDRDLSREKKVIPMLMVIGRLSQVLVDAELRHLTSIVAVTGEVFDPHSVACLIGYGAAAIYPYLFYYTVEQLTADKADDIKLILRRTRRAMGTGLLKIMSKMGISTISSYRNSKLFDVIGLSDDIIGECFDGSRGLLKGLGYNDIDQRLNTYHQRAYAGEFEDKKNVLYKGGFYKYKKGEEYHDFSRPVISAIQKVAETGSKEDYKNLSEMIDKRDKKFIRDFFELHSSRKPICIDEVEPIETIFKHFSTAAMSMGSISQEAHEVLAEAMNTIGGKSNSGEGGEDPARYGTIKNSKIKQVASGRFGVTPEYLRSAEEIQIKVAQGAKPGEGGQLPGSKVSPLIASLRYTKPGVTLISPPPHHDIYSIEDLAQLIFDLKQINPKAKIAVKLVSTAGVGTIAAGVAKAYADKIIISGGDGGTGAAPIGSIRFAGNPWELGLIEAHNALKANNLRSLVTVETDGGLKTALDVIKAAIFGAEEYAFGTGALVIVGCMMLRVCHLNTCGVGVATQDPHLRARFKGNVQKVINYFTLLAKEIREILAQLGYRSLEEIIGKTELLKVIDDEFANKFDFQQLLEKIEGVDICQVPYNEPFDKNEFEKEIVKELMPTIKDPSKPVIITRKITNLNRSFGTRISGEIAEIHGNKGLPDDTITINLEGVTGQSLGAFLSKGVTINVNGAGNDYIGKGMNGGHIVITSLKSGSNFALGGNTCLYGATGGTLYISGKVGERFAVRNSGATTVVEGTGDHPCEYMTGGTVVILGDTGVNFGAGMTGGKAFVYDKEGTFYEKLNLELVEAIRIDTDEWDFEMFELKHLLKDYVTKTGSKKAQNILNNIRTALRKFWMVVPRGAKPTLETNKKGE
ncbi:MAG: glutamate synthase large subunit [Sulfurovum sp.]|nr:glutamate synthase large subunit [Sulfurovum sp.]MCB4745730.1 glutamate synthase large subunit [Sulfurovum sp.]MCB4748102.1 glutamate synthase large subunit [Sulfurovum sp.]MCB4749774.1 glutamate synthase large subunit [Sulfurovum sp.]MCB4750913.1 glutamate synthase large subunit [Sulfurovum sp.]